MDDRLADHPILGPIAQEEAVHALAAVRDASVVVTDRRLAIASEAPLLVDVPIDNLRRIQFDIERSRPATLVVVPERPGDEPQVLAVPPEQYRAVADVLVVIGQRLAGEGQSGADAGGA